MSRRIAFDMSSVLEAFVTSGAVLASNAVGMPAA
jgi:hypothetical protein